MQKHTNSCINAPESAKTIKANSQQVNLVNNPELKTRQGVIDNYVYVDKIDCNKLLDLEYKFAKIKFFHTLRSSFKISNYVKLFGELLNKVYEDIKKGVEVEIKNYKKEIALVLPALTRWSTHLECIKSLMKSQTAIQQMLFDPSTMTLNSEPIIATLKAFESNNSAISTIYSRFNTILVEIQKIECSYSTEI
ncbi:278_t:CDS:2 [Dentiscutata erythropus]|uniref:278_t:CDS:1 n=1 Tax=Dentiscutata erythropus TaxID=1348616 RepID=A0A9N9GYR2_9GLOM|nr:278_t:CDS:2 [Dentiscutata erythropus]